jgi:hypothetical protein
MITGPLVARFSKARVGRLNNSPRRFADKRQRRWKAALGESVNAFYLD